MLARKMLCSLVRFGVYFDQSVLKNSLKISKFLYKTYFYIKNNYYMYTFAMGYL